MPRPGHLLYSPLSVFSLSHSFHIYFSNTMAYRLFTLLPLLLAAVSAETVESMNDVASVAEPMAPISAPATQQQASVAAVAPAVISHAQANAVIQAAVAKAVEIKMPSNIAVTDPAGHLISFLRMDGALLVSIEVAQKKARTVSMFGGKYRTGDLYNATSPGGTLYGEYPIPLDVLALANANTR
jgi:uncharacterized protein GlcG (DUF336 family)